MLTRMLIRILSFCTVLISTLQGDESFLNHLITRNCKKVTEINRDPCALSGAILTSLSNKKGKKKYISISKNIIENQYLKKISNIAKEKKIEFIFWRINESYIEIETTDLLIINSLETYHHIKFVLDTFPKNIRKYICIPNMYKNGLPLEREESYSGDYFEYPNPIASNRQGVWQAVNDFLDMHPEWTIMSKSDSEDDLFLTRKSEDSFFKPFRFSKKVNYYLKNKIILCTGPSLGRYKMLKDNLESEMRLIPYKKVFIKTNDDAIMDIKLFNKKPNCERIPYIEKYVDCWNCIISSLQAAVKDKEVKDDDIIVFKHETVFLNDLNLFKRAIQKMLSGYNMIVRSFWGGSTSDIFFVKVSEIKKIINNLSLLEKIPDDQYVEMMLHNTIVMNIPRVYAIQLGTAPLSSNNISTWGCNGLGFFHLHHYFIYSKNLNEFIDVLAQKFWKKENYLTLFNKEYEIKNHKYYTSLSQLSADASK